MLKINRITIRKWLNTGTYSDHRGRHSAHARRYITPEVTERIAALKQQRIANNRYFVGSDYVQMDYAHQYPKDPRPTIWYIEEVTRQRNLQTRQPKQKKPGGAKYLLYPEQAIKKLGKFHQSADFIGKKYIAGRTSPITIFATSYYAPIKLYQIKRVQAETTRFAIDQLITLWQTYPIPHIFRIDNGLQFRGSARSKRAIGTFLRFLLNLQVIPLFGSPSKPWTNPHVEGHNRVFSEKVWGRNFFTSLEQIDQECDRFNQESRALFLFKYATLLDDENLRYLTSYQSVSTDHLESVKGQKIYFIRFVEMFEQEQSAHVVILNDTVTLPEQYAHQFVFVEWDLEQEQLNIYSEYDQVLTLIQQSVFHLNL